MNLKIGSARLGGSTLMWIVISAVAIIFGGFLISGLTSSVMPIQASGEAEQVDGLFRFLMFAGGVVFLLVQGLLVVTIIKFRRKPGDESDGASFNGNPTLEIIWTAIPALVIIFLSIYSYSVYVSIRAPKPNEMVINVTGQRFVWSFSYDVPAGSVPAEMPQTFNDGVLHTYVGRPVVLHMQTRDVNHAFWVPTMRIKQDLLAGRVTDVRFTPTKAGIYRVVCAELCGGGHGTMHTYIQVYADEQEWRDRFMDRRVYSIINPSTDPVVLGESILLGQGTRAYPCAGCHTNTNLAGWTGTTGPLQNGIGDTAVRRATSSGLGSPEAYLANSIRHPNHYIVPGFQAGLMPQFGPTVELSAPLDGAYYVYMPDEDLIPIVSYLCTQTSTGESACGDHDAIVAAVEAQQ